MGSDVQVTRSQGALIAALLAFLCIHVLAADVVGLYLYSQIGDDKSTTQPFDLSPTEPGTDFTPECDPEGDKCP